jgi:hypothetical protein
MGVETGLTGSSTVGLTGVPDNQTGLTGPTDPNSPVLENSASSNLEHDKADVLIGGNLLLVICMIQATKLIERFGGLLLSLHW